MIATRCWVKLNLSYHLYYFPIRLSSKKSNQPKNTMRILNVAEKNDAAKNISLLLSNGNSRRREGLSKFNKIYEFDYNFNGRPATMMMTSVSGHLLNYAFTANYRKWLSCSPEELFEAPVVKQCPEDFQQIQNTIKREVRNSDVLIIWTDCDREGENIGFEIISVCREVKPNIQIYRAKFSEITKTSVQNAMGQLEQPNKLVSDAVDVRSELDLRIGASFTRFQTLRLKRVFPEILGDSLISYGSCQFPTMGFVVQRYKEVQDFIPEKFWKIKVLHTINDLTVEFLWKRVRLFDELGCRVLHERCIEQPVAKVESVETKPKNKWRPLPLDTIELEKAASRKLKLTAKETMRIAERLYSQGYISYPRTETNSFPANMNLQDIVKDHVPDNRWGQFAQRVLQEGVNPRQGKKSDQAHPPIHPIKHTDGLAGNERKLYEYIVRHFLACISKDAEGFQTVVQIDIHDEKFVASGLQIVALNYLEVFPYEKWNSKEIHMYQSGQSFDPTAIDMADGETSAPNLLTEADLIALMDKHGIGTDATHAEHIDKIQERSYVGLMDERYFVPGELGIGLVDGYDSMGFEMSKPYLRAELENDLKRICEGTKDPQLVLREQVNKYRDVFRKTVQQANKLDVALGKYLKSQPNVVDNNLNAMVEAQPEHALKCSACRSGMVLRTRENGAKYISCLTFPACRNAIWLPNKVLDVQVTPNTCPQCGPDVRLLTFKFRQGSMIPYYPDVHTGCLGGCDGQFLDMLEIRRNTGGASTTNTNNVNTQANRPPANPPSNVNFSQPANVQNRQNFNPPPPPPAANNQQVGGSQWGANAPGNSQWPNNRQANTQWNNNANANNRQGNQDIGNNANDADVQCNCAMPARRLTVQKESANKGRQFYACSKPMGDAAKCDFFMWADTAPVPQNNVQPYAGNRNFNGGGDANFNNRNNFGNNSNYNNRNDFGNNSNFNNRNNGGNNSNYKGKNKFNQSRTTTGTGSTRRCGICRQEGHTRSTCPQKND